MADTITDLASPPRPSLVEIPPATMSPSLVTTCTVVATSTIRRFMRTPQQLAIATIQAAVFLAIFRYVLGGAIDAGLFSALGTGDVSYVDFLVPGYVVSGALFAGTGAAAGVAEDVERGFSDRLRSLPVPRVGLLAGRSVADTVLLTWAMAMATAIGFLVGFRIHGSVAAALAAFALCIFYAFAFTWVFISIGLLSGSAQVAQGLSMLVFPLTTVSSAFVPVETMPGWMHAVADNQPITIMTNAVRSLVLGDPSLAGLEHGAGYWVVLSLVWCVALMAVFVPIAVVRYRRS